MENSQASACFLLRVLICILILPASTGQLAPAETRILFRVRQLLEFPEALQGWTRWTNFCYLPPSASLVIVCKGNHVAELTVIGNKTKASPSYSSKPVSGNLTTSQHTLSEKFSIGSFFTTLTKLSNLKVLSLVSLGLWGPLPPKIDRLESLEVLNISSNYIFGQIPAEFGSFKHLRKLVLADNLLNGSIPDLSSLVALEDLDLSNNNLEGVFPKLGGSILSVILKNNSLRSDIPQEVTNLDQLHRFDISSNKFVGPIPTSLFSLQSIQYINLGENELCGALPTNVSCSDGLKFVDISHNFLIGKLPACLGSRTVLYSWNCLSGGNSSKQHPYPFCQKEAVAVEPPNAKKSSSIKLGIVLGIIGGALGVVGVLSLLILGIVRRAQAKNDENYKLKGSIKRASFRTSPDPISNAIGQVPQRMRSGRSAMLGLPPYHLFTLEEMEDATNNFDPSTLMEEGSQGQLYKGSLRNGSLVLVKCLKLGQRPSPQSLRQHKDAISKLRHRNLVSVLGHCGVTFQDHPGSTLFIVLEHISNGSLRDHLADWRKREMLKWPQRMVIIIGIGNGIHFLHTGIAPGIFGNNLKIENILLDERLTPRISNYNIPMPSKGGAESPWNNQDASNQRSSGQDPEKNDIYQLGVILLELITGRPVTPEAELDDFKNELERGLMEAPSVLRGMADSSIQGTYAYQSLRTTVEITISCLSKDSSKRPSIEDVLWNLQYSMQVQEGWTSSENLSTRP